MHLYIRAARRYGHLQRLPLSPEHRRAQPHSRLGEALVLRKPIYAHQSIKHVTPSPFPAYFSSTGKSGITAATLSSSISLPNLTLANCLGTPTGFCDPSSRAMAVVDSSLTLLPSTSRSEEAPAEGGVGSISMGAGPGRTGGSAVVVVESVVVLEAGAGGKNSGRNSTSEERSRVSRCGGRGPDGATYMNRRRFDGRR